METSYLHRKIIKGVLRPFLELPKQIVFFEYPDFSLHGMLFIVSKIKIAIKKTVNKHDVETNIRISARSLVV